MKDLNPVFRKAVIGGFNRQDVIEYIEKTKNEFFEYKKENEKIIGELYEKINSLSSLLEEAKAVKEEIDCEQNTDTEAEENSSLTVSEISKVALELKSAAEMICCNFENLFKKMGLSQDNAEAEPTIATEVEEGNRSSVNTEEEIDKSNSFFSDILSEVCPPENKNKKPSQVTNTSQFDDLLNIH